MYLAHGMMMKKLFMSHDDVRTCQQSGEVELWGQTTRADTLCLERVKCCFRTLFTGIGIQCKGEVRLFVSVTQFVT